MAVVVELDDGVEESGGVGVVVVELDDLEGCGGVGVEEMILLPDAPEELDAGGGRPVSTL